MCLSYPTESMTFYKIFSHKDNQLWPAFRNCLLKKDKPLGIISEVFPTPIDFYKPFERINESIEGVFHAFLNKKDAFEVMNENWNFTDEEKIVLPVYGDISTYGYFGSYYKRPAVTIKNMHINGYYKGILVSIKNYALKEDICA